MSVKALDAKTEADSEVTVVEKKPKAVNPRPQLYFLSRIKRIKRDIMAIYEDPPPGIFVLQDEENLTLIHALITGSFDTPYEGGFFYFTIRCSSEYPIEPPRVKFMTTGGGKVRFNPNLYECGKVCLSILGTWHGPAWSPALTLSSLLISIQSLLNEHPYHNEPGFEKERYSGESRAYNEIIKHETVRVAVVGMIENDYGLNIPPQFVKVMNDSFIQFYEYYEGHMKRNLHRSGTPMRDPFGSKRGDFNYAEILKRLEKIYKRLLIIDTDPPASSGDSSTANPSSVS